MRSHAKAKKHMQKSAHHAEKAKMHSEHAHAMMNAMHEAKPMKKAKKMPKKK
jgi:hypothetical protein